MYKYIFKKSIFLRTVNDGEHAVYKKNAPFHLVCGSDAKSVWKQSWC